MHSIRSLHRGLKALEVLNLKRVMTVAAMAREINLPRTTTFRVLENLCEAGYLNRNPDTGTYRLTIRVRNLSSGYNDEAWLSEIVRPLTIELSKLVIWPISIMAPKSSHMSLRFTTDTNSPMAIDYYKEGTTLPILSTATGHVYLANCGDRERELVLDTLDRDVTNVGEKALAITPAAIATTIERVQRNGFAVNIRSLRSHEPGKTSTIAVPIMRDGQFLASLAMRYIDSALNIEELKDRYLPTLLEYATKMEVDFESND